MSSPITNIPRVWATNTNYSAGLDVGTPTKVDPGSALAAEGFEPAPIVAAHVNHILNGVTAPMSRHLTVLCKPRQVGTLSSDGEMGIATLKTDPGVTLCVGHAGNQAMHVSDLGSFFLTGAGATSITSSVFAAAVSINEVHLFGFGGNGNCYSNDDGATWTAGALLNAFTLHGIFDAHSLKFLGLYADTVAHSIGANASWTAVTVTGAGQTNMSALAALSNGTILTDTAIGTYKKSTDGGSTWGTAGAPPNSGSCSNRGRLAGNGGSKIYHAVHTPSSGMQISSTSDGTTWTLLSNIIVPADFTVSDDTNGPGLAVCPDTGWIFLLASNDTSGHGLLYASPDGLTWTDPLRLSAAYIDSRSFQASRGRIFLLDSFGTLYASDGVGVS
jgi:hypothetical protein